MIFPFLFGNTFSFPSLNYYLVFQGEKHEYPFLYHKDVQELFLPTQWPQTISA